MGDKNLILKKVVQAKSGDRKAFEFLVDEFQGSVCCYIDSIIRNYSIACELAQDTFITAFKNIHRLEQSEKFKYWLFGIARNKCLDHKKSPKRKEIATDEEIVISHESESKRIHIAEVIKKVLANLSLEERELILLIDYQEFSYQEVCGLLNISVGNIKSKIHRARNRFIEEYSNLNVEFTGFIVPKNFNDDGNNNVA